MDSLPLLRIRKNTLLKLEIPQIDPEGTLKGTNELRIKTVKTPSDNIGTVLAECKDVFQGIGCFRAKNIGKEYSQAGNGN